MAKPDGGPAFPNGVSYKYGMSLRDYFAAQALSGVMSVMAFARPSFLSFEDVAENAYKVADDMLAEREKE